MRVSEPLKFYSEVVNEDFMQSLLSAEGVRHRNCIFSAAVVIWLTIFQRLRPHRSLAHAVDSLRDGASDLLLQRASGSVRVRRGNISGSTAGLSQARSRLPLAVVENVVDTLFTSMTCPEAEQDVKDVYIFDGTTLSIAHSAKNIAEYPQFRNQHGPAHYPLVQVVAAVNVMTGLALRPAMGPYCGKNAGGEIALAEQILPRLPKGAIAIGDRYYGMFRFAYAAKNNNVPVLCRFKEINAKRFIGSPGDTSGEKHVVWTPSKHELKKYPELSAESSVEGRFVWAPLIRRGFRPQCFVLFTTLDWTVDKLLGLYAQRWNVELDLRDIKQTLEMDFIHGQSPDIVKKEILLGFAAYNLIKHCISTAAAAAKLPPRSLSFSMVLNRIDLLGTLLLTADKSKNTHDSIERALCDLKPLLVYRRPTKRQPEPRKVWPRGARNFFVSSSSRHQERELLIKQSQRLRA